MSFQITDHDALSSIVNAYNAALLDDTKWATAGTRRPTLSAGSWPSYCAGPFAKIRGL